MLCSRFHLLVKLSGTCMYKTDFFSFRLANGSFDVVSVDAIMGDLQQFIVCIVRKACR